VGALNYQEIERWACVDFIGPLHNRTQAWTTLPVVVQYEQGGLPPRSPKKYGKDYWDGERAVTATADYKI